jgi:hypothetical protein
MINIAVIIYGLQAPEFIDTMTLDEVISAIDSSRISGKSWRFKNKGNQTVIIPAHNLDKIIAIYQDAVIKPVAAPQTRPSLVT